MLINWDYIAGFTDGEGYLGIIGRGPRIQWGQKDKHQLDVIKDFLESEGFHPNMPYRKPRPAQQQPNGLYILGLTRRDEVLRVVSILKEKVVLKLPACLKIEKWAVEHPPYANMNPIDFNQFNELYQAGYTQGEVAKRMNYGHSIIGSFAREHGFQFKMGGRVIDGIRQPAMTSEEYRIHKAKKLKTKNCADCDKPINFDSTWCINCAKKHRVKPGKYAIVEVPCTNCGALFKRQRSQLTHYKVPFCSKNCSLRYRPQGWSKAFASCLDCGTTEIPHLAKGRCKKCHWKWYKLNRLEKSS